MRLVQKYLLIPLGILYGALAFLRNYFYDKHWLYSYQPKQFAISVGNLSMGGTGKTPMVEYLVRHVQPRYKIALLSRGYGRQNARRSVLATVHHTAKDLGDEPMQYFQKFPNIRLVVDGNRIRGVKLIESKFTDNQIIILDDAFQHRRIKPHMSILLTDYEQLYTQDAVVPAGRLREFACGAQRAHLIVVSKCPTSLQAKEKTEIRTRLKPKSHQQVLFSHIAYQALKFVSNPYKIDANQCFEEVLLLTAIAKAAPLKAHIEATYNKVVHLAYRDHYDFNQKAILNIKIEYEALSSSHKCLITTEKDWQRLKDNPHFSLLKAIPIAYVPIMTVFSASDEKLLLEFIHTAISTKS